MLFKFALVLTLLTTTANVAARVLLTLYALHLGAQPLAVGILAATFAVFPAVLSWPIGMLSDRFGSRWQLVISNGWVTLALVTAYFFPSQSMIYLAGCMIGVSSAFQNVTLQNLIGRLSKPEERTQNYSYFSLTLASTLFVGPLLVGFGIDHTGYSNTCLYLMLLGIVPILALLIRGGMLPGGSRDAKTAGSVLHALRDRDLLRVLATGSLVVAGIELFQVFMPVYGHSIGLSASAIGLVLSMFAAAAFVVRLAMQTLLTRLTERELLAYSFYLSMASLILVPFFENVMVLVLLAFIFGLGMGCGQPITMSLTFNNSAPGRSGEVLGVRVTVNQLTRVSVPVLFGSIASAFGLSPVFWIYALLLGSGGILSRAKHE